MYKRGELTSSQIIGIVLAIAGFIIALLVIAVFLEDGGETDREICRLSILARATAPTVAQAAVPLDCATEKICVTSEQGLLGFGKGECKEFVGEDNVRTVVIRGTESEQIDALEQIMAESMYFCWSMTGQGKLDLFGRAAGELGYGSAESSCIICSRLAFAEDISLELLSKTDLDSYLKDNFIPLPGSSDTYLYAFSDETTSAYPSIDRINDFDAAIEGGETEFAERREGTAFAGSNDGRHMAFVFSQMKVPHSNKVLENWGKIALGGLGGSALMPIQTLRAISNPYVLLGVGAVAGTAVGIGYANAGWQQTAAATYCGDVTTTATEEDFATGCSTIQGIGYNVQDINTLCDNIHSDP